MYCKIKCNQYYYSNHQYIFLAALIVLFLKGIWLISLFCIYAMEPNLRRKSRRSHSNPVVIMGGDYANLKSPIYEYTLNYQIYITKG